MLDRLTHRVHILEANGESYRQNPPKRACAAETKVFYSALSAALSTGTRRTFRSPFTPLLS